MNNPKLKSLLAVASVFLIVCVLANLITLGIGVREGQLDTIECLTTMLNALVAAFGAFYVDVGCNKSQGKGMLRLFLIFFALVQVLMLISPTVRGSMLAIIVIAAKLFLLIVLAAVPNLGVRASKQLSFFVIVLSAAEIITLLPLFEASAPFYARVITQIVLSIVCYLLICGKYEDKKARGTK